MAYIWTPISNAFEAYRRRLIVDPNAVYEHTWRLIHIHESLIVTLGAAFATRLFDFWTNEPGRRIKDEDLTRLQIQQMITGLNKDSSRKDDPKGCLSGSIFEWISLLNSAKNLVLDPPCPFITALKDYLEKTPDKQEKSQLAFLPDWERIASTVPPNHKENGLSRIWRFQAINELRNKLAHVPISGRIIPNLHNGLRKELLLLLTDKTEWINADTTAEAIDSSYTNDASTNPVEVIEEQPVSLEELKPEDLRKKAEDAFKASDYKNAVMYYDEMAKLNLPNYTDVAQSRHGAALWRVANRSEADIKERKAQFERSITLLAEASKHWEIGYKAESHYQKSKALWHLSEIDVENREKLIKESIEEVEIALGLSLEQRYIGWYEWLREKIETSDDETDTSDNETGNSNDETDNSENQ